MKNETTTSCTRKVTTWKQLLADPRVKAAEIWREDNDGLDYWVPLADGFTYQGSSCIHEWTKKECIASLNDVVPATS